MLRGMFCFGVKCECVYSPLEEDMQHAMCSVQHMIQSATDTRSRGSSSVSSADFYMMCMFARVTVLCAAYDPVSHRHAVDGEFKRQLRRLLYDMFARVVCVVCVPDGGWICVFRSVPERRPSFWNTSLQFSFFCISLMTRISSTSWYSIPLTVRLITRSTALVSRRLWSPCLCFRLQQFKIQFGG